MNGFYLTLNESHLKESKNIFRKKGLNFSKIIDIGTFKINCFSDNNNENKVYKDEDDFIIAAGTFIYKNQNFKRTYKNYKVHYCNNMIYLFSSSCNSFK